MGLSIVVPTVARPSLPDTLMSIAPQLTEDDQVVVMVDGDHPEVTDLVNGFRALYRGAWMSVESHTHGSWGHAATNQAFENWTTGTHWARMDDDDIYLPGALDVMREAACSLPVVFRARWGSAHPASGVVLWQNKEIRVGSIATPMIVAPASKARYSLEYTGDFDYALALQAIFGQFIWRDEIICEVRPK